MIYTHVMQKGALGIKSPLDRFDTDDGKNWSLSVAHDLFPGWEELFLDVHALLAGPWLERIQVREFEAVAFVVVMVVPVGVPAF